MFYAPQRVFSKAVQAPSSPGNEEWKVLHVSYYVNKGKQFALSFNDCQMSDKSANFFSAHFIVWVIIDPSENKI